MIESLVWAVVVLVIAGLAFTYGYIDLRKRDQRRDIDVLREEVGKTHADMTKRIGDLNEQLFKSRRGY